jgi:hypothetical protein
LFGVGLGTPPSSKFQDLSLEILYPQKYHNRQICLAMVKSYSKYELSQTFGLVASSLPNVVSITGNGQKSSGPGQAIVGANEEVLTWDIKKGELVSRWKEASCTSQVTVIARSQIDPDIYAVGCVLLKVL